MNARDNMLTLLHGSLITQVLGVTARTGLAESIGSGARLAEIAAEHDIPPERMIRLLRALTSIGCCVEDPRGSFTLTELGSLLRRDDPSSLAAYAMLCAGPLTQQPWLHLESSLRTGNTAFDEVFGIPAFEYCAREPEHAAVFNAAMSQGTRALAGALPQHHDFARYTTVADIGGGDGTLLAAILRATPGLHGVLFDLEAGSAQAAEILRQAGVEDRCTVVTGDFRETVPEGADLYLIKSVLHNWDDEHAVLILRHCRQAMAEGGRVLILDPVLPDSAVRNRGGINPYLIDLHMLLVVGGRERSRGEFDELCAKAGLTVTGATAVATGGVDLIEAVAR